MAGTCPIKPYYNGKNIFLTGGTGFLGKVLIEKLLRSTNVGKIYVLIRPKKGLGLRERVDQIVSSKLFENIKELKPESTSKIVPINGDCASPGLGLSTEDRNFLIQTVHIVFHAAAIVKFDDFLKSAILTNLRAVRDMAQLALEMKNIEVFVHVSTSFCNIENRKIVDEVLYPPYGSWKDAIELAEGGDSHVVDILTQKYIDPFPNTYTYTKRLAEHCVSEMLVGKIPTIICRPSIVISTIAEPFQGYIDNFNGPVALLLAGGTGLIRIVYGDMNADTNFFPVDNVVKLMLVSACLKGSSREKETVTVFHASKICDVKFTVQLLINLGKSLYWLEPFDKKIWFPRNSMTKSFYIFYINVILFHVLPVLVLDLFLWLADRKPFIFNLQKKIYISNMAIQHFIFNHWIFKNEYCLNILKKISKEDLLDFDFTIRPKTNEEFREHYFLSCRWARIHLLKEKEEISKELRAKTWRMYYLDIAIKVAFFGWLAWILLVNMNILGIVFGRILAYWLSL